MTINDQLQVKQSFRSSWCIKQMFMLKERANSKLIMVKQKEENGFANSNLSLGMSKIAPRSGLQIGPIPGNSSFWFCRNVEFFPWDLNFSWILWRVYLYLCQKITISSMKSSSFIQKCSVFVMSGKNSNEYDLLVEEIWISTSNFINIAETLSFFLDLLSFFLEFWVFSWFLEFFPWVLSFFTLEFFSKCPICKPELVTKWKAAVALFSFNPMYSVNLMSVKVTSVWIAIQ